MMKKLLTLVLFVVTLLIVTHTTALADTGPKPSVVVTFEGVEQTNCFVTLLSKTSSTGPESAYRGYPSSARYDENDEDLDIWEKFVAFEDTDGFYFLQYYTKLTDTNTFTWGYCPPSEFKILMYFPDTNSFAVSDNVYERYAFDSYYTVNAEGLDTSEGREIKTFEAAKSYDYSREIVSLIARIILTITLEVGIALLFGFRAKKQILIILAANVVTQTLLNILLNSINYHQGQMMF